MQRRMQAVQAIVMSSLLVIFSFSAVTVHAGPTVTLPDFSVLAEQNSPVVVNISTKRKVERQTMPQFQGMPDEMLRYFFGLPRNKNPHDQMPKEEVSSLGSGFIISSDGYIVTNNHVVEGADEVIVKLSNGEKKTAKVIGLDKHSDIALLKVDAKGLKAAKIGSSKKLKVGQWVLAIGEPFGLDYTVTHGIVSALGRSLPNDQYVPFIQSDVAINPGNSGGPLFNMDGEVVGVNAQIFSKSGGYMGLSFSIPIDIAMNVVDQLKENGRVERGYLGVSVQEMTDELAQSFDLPKATGAIVASIEKGSAADEAGLKVSDIILEFNGKKINKSADLPPAVGSTAVGKTVKMKILREGKRKTLRVKLQSLDKLADASSSQENEILGVVAEDLGQDVLKQINIPFGVGVTDVLQGSPANKAGILPGDIIVTLNFHPIKSVAELNKILESAPKGRSIPVRVMRDKRSVFLPLMLN